MGRAVDSADRGIADFAAWGASGAKVRDARRAAKDVGHKDAKALLHWAGDPQGADPGMFVTRLIKAIFAADDVNVELLRVGWPGLVAAVEVYRKDIDWIGTLRRIARAADEEVGA